MPVCDPVDRHESHSCTVDCTAGVVVESPTLTVTGTLLVVGSVCCLNVVCRGRNHTFVEASTREVPASGTHERASLCTTHTRRGLVFVRRFARTWRADGTWSMADASAVVDDISGIA